MAIIDKVAVERRNLSPAALYVHAVRRNEAAVVSTGALTAETGKHTGRSPKDKFFVREPTSQDAIWWHAGNQPIATDRFDGLLRRMQEYIDTHEVYTQDVFACADPRFRLRVRVISELAWHSLFARNLFIRPNADELLSFEPDFTVISLPSVKADPSRDGT
ncbi:MAG: phosphoenolpyruvate carboxykinase (ATP), partial [Chloroflexi bacterium]